MVPTLYELITFTNISLKEKSHKSRNLKMSLVTEEIKAKAEVYNGPDLCKAKVRELLAEVGLPNGLLPLDNIEECGLVRETGFVWFKRKAKKIFKFVSTGKLVSYAPEITGFVENNKIKKLNGVKSKEIAIWVSVNEVSVMEQDKVLFKALGGLFKTYPFSAFELEDLGEAVEEGKVGDAK